MANSKGSALTVLIIVILILLVIGLWFYADTTKELVSGAFDKAKDLAP